MKRISTVVAVLVLWTAAPAWAETQVAGTGEPAYTKSTQNTQWISWQSPGGVDGYRLHVVYYKDNVQVHELRAPVGVSGTMWANWSGIQTLTEGSTYAICARGEYLISGMWFSDGQDSCASGAAQGKRTSTTIDRTAPTIAAVVAGGAATTRQDAIGLHVDFTDAAAGPSPATYVCLQAGGDPAAACGGALSYSAACSVPAGPGKTTTFDCQLDGAGLPDGPVGACVIAADAARADNPSSADQSGSVASANTSAMKCDTVILDRAAPALTVDASATSVTAGTPVGFTASASDATSGLAGEVAWTWVDGSAPGSGSAQSHVFTQPGTYRVAARVKDAAGNETVVEKEIAVLAPPASQPDGAAQPPAAPPAPEAPSGGSSQEPDAPAGPTAGDISDAAGGAPVVRTEVGSASLLVPSRFRMAKGRRHLVIGVSATRGGTLTLRLVRGGRVVVRRVGRVEAEAGAGAWRMTVPPGLRAGRYVLKVSFTPDGAGTAATSRTRISVLARKR